MVTTVHVARPSALPTLLRTLTSVYEHTVGRFILGASREVIAVSEAVGEHARHLGAPADCVSVIRNGVDHERYFPLDTDNPSSSRPLVVFVGRLISNKGPELLLEALATSKARLDADVVFLGDGPLRYQLQREARNRGLGEQVRFQGHSSDIAAWLRRADVLVRPSFTEGLPLALLEALASRVCVVASDIPGNADLIRHGESGLLFKAGDARALADALQRVLADPAARGMMAANGWQTSLGYSWDVCADAVGKVLMRGASRGARDG